MRIVENGSTGISAALSPEEVMPLGDRIDEVRSWVGERGLSLPISREDEGARIDFPSRPVALAFLGTFVPGALSGIARPIAEGVADYAVVDERDGVVSVTIRYVGDAGSGTGREPHDQTSEDFASFAELANEAGFEAEHIHSDHDTIEAVLRPSP
jgi:hypothetical protein